MKGSALANEEAMGAAFGEYGNVFRDLIVEIRQARDEWFVGMASALKTAQEKEESAEADLIQGALDSVNSGWPMFETSEHAGLMAEWSFESREAVEVNGVYARAVARAVKSILSARANLVRDVSVLQMEVLQGCSEAHLIEANRIQDLLEGVFARRGGDASGQGAPDGWEKLSLGVANERELFSPYVKGKGLVVLKVHVEKALEIKETRLPYDGRTPVLKVDRPDYGSRDYFVPGDRLLYEDESGYVIGLIIVGSVDAEIQFSTHALVAGTVTTSFVLEDEAEVEEVTETLAALPWPIEIEEVKQLKEEIESACAEWGSEWAGLPYALLEELNVAKEARERELQGKSEELDSLRHESARFADKETRKSRALKDRVHELEVTIAEGFSEIRRVESIFDEVVRPNTRELLRFEAEDFRLESKEAAAAIRTYSKRMEKINEASDALVIECVERLDLIRCELMKSGVDDVLLLANRVQVTIEELSGTGLGCEFPTREFPRWQSSVASRRLTSKREKALTKGEIQDSLRWLLKHQDTDGKWDTDEFNMHDPAADKCDGAGGMEHDVGVTGLAVLAFTACADAERSDFGWAMTDGGDWLLGCQDQGTGLIGERLGHTYLYSHAIASKALCELYLLTGLERYKMPAQKAIDFISEARNPQMAWRYQSPPNGDNDTSVTGWMVLAIKAAEDAGLVIDEGSYSGAMRWIENVTDPETGRVGYDSVGSASSRVANVNDHFHTDRTESMTALGLLSRIEMGEEKKRSEVLKSHAALLLKALPEWDAGGLYNDVYYWYCGTRAMSEMGGKEWKSWRKAMKKVVLASQRERGSAKGSFDPIGPWGYAGGRVYSTAMMVNVMTLALL